MSFFQSIWLYNVQIVPVILSLVLYYMPSTIRKKLNFNYTPIYFTLLPLRFMNEYIKNRVFFNEFSRKRMLVTSIWSTLVDAFLIPLIVGIILSFILTIEVFYQFILVLLLHFIYRFIKSLYAYYQNYYYKFSTLVIMILVYITFTILVIDYLNMSYHWALTYTSKGEYLQLVINIKNIILRDTILVVGLLCLLVNVFSHYLLKTMDEKQNVYGYTSKESDN